jgi:hypothetical protein
MDDSSNKVEKPEKKEKLKPHQRKRYEYKNFDWPTERENYKRLCRGDEMLTYEVSNSELFLHLYVYGNIPSQGCFLCLFLNVYQSTSSSGLFIP